MRYKNSLFDVPEGKTIRVIIDTDAANEADDQYAIVHALLSPRLNVKAITAAHFGNEKSPHSMEDSYQEIIHIISLMNTVEKIFDIPVFRGCENPISGCGNPEIAPATEAIINEAMIDSEEPLYVIVLGAITNVASAILAQPSICKRFTLIWVGGNAYPEGGWEYNLKNDVSAARTVFNSSVPLWQIPRNAYQSVLVSMSELALNVAPCGEIGKYLFSHMVEWGKTYWGKRSNLRTGECWFLGDSAAVGLLLNEHEFHYHLENVPYINDDYTYGQRNNNRQIRVYDSVDSRFIVEDMYAKLKLYTKFLEAL